LLRKGDPDLVLTKEWIGSPQYIPAAFEVLAARGWVAAFLRKLPENTTAASLQRMLLAFGVPEISRETGTHRSAESTRPQPTECRRRDFARPRAFTSEPWLPWAPETRTPGLSPLHQVLLGQALMLCRAPARARSVGFQAQVASWLAETLAQQSGLDLREPKQTPGAGPEQGSPSQPQEASSADDPLPSSACDGDTVQERPGDEVSRNTILPKLGSEVPASKAHDGETFQDVPDLAPDITSEVARAEVSAVETCLTVQSALGGIFFLLNVALHLKLYGDFTSPRSRALELNIWDFLSLLGRALLGEETCDDPVWEVLARLAGRQKEQPPGASFEPPKDWQLPAEWLEPFPEQFEWKEVIQDTRIQVWHPARFLLLDKHGDAASDRSDGLERWLSWIVPYVGARLVRGLGRGDAAEFLIRLPARIALTATHIHIHYPLDHHPIEIRSAGLDRDPGWIPAAGRYVAYHFD
jgi:hypothetical protein